MDTITYLRQFRIINYAIFDLVVSFIGIYLLAPGLTKLFKKINIDIPKTNWLYLTLPIGILVHILVGTVTPMTKNFLDTNSNYLLKILILVLLILGLRNIKKNKK
jgi:hypothetical protein